MKDKYYCKLCLNKGKVQELSKTKKHTIKVVIDRVVVKPDNKERIAADVEKALKESYGELEIDILNHEELGLNRSQIQCRNHLIQVSCLITLSDVNRTTRLADHLLEIEEHLIG